MTLHLGDCRTVMADMAPESIDAIVTDPPYGLSFMGRAWDHGVPGVPFWTEALRVLKPGGHLLAFGGDRTIHRLMVAIEDAGFEIRTQLVWLHGQGFPKSANVSKMIDKTAGVKREVVGSKIGTPGYSLADNGRTNDVYGNLHDPSSECAITAPVTPEAQQWDGWGTALKPAMELICMARKPLARGNTVAANVLAHGTGAINVDGCRIEAPGGLTKGGSPSGDKIPYMGGNVDTRTERTQEHPQGRWPANVVLDEEAAAMLDAQSGISTSPTKVRGKGTFFTRGHQSGNGYRPDGEPYANEKAYQAKTHLGPGDTGGASRFMKVVTPDPLDDEAVTRFLYCPKSSRAERNRGLEGMEERTPHPPEANGRAWDIPGSHSTARANFHPTVKPVALMRWLVRMVTPPGGIVLDPFMGSGSTGVAAIQEGFSFIGIDLDPDYLAIAERRIAHVQQQGRQAGLEMTA